MMKIQRFVCNMIQENCYVLSDDSNECVIVDCGAWYDTERKAILAYIRDNHLVPKHLLCTHGHCDHNFGNNTIFDEFALGPEVHKDDESLMNKLPQQSMMFIGAVPPYPFPAISRLLDDGDTITFGQHTIKVIHTPGHSRGSVCFYIEDEHILLTGDTLFHLSIGRTDLEGGSMMQIIQSLRSLAQLPDETQVLPGHGGVTTIGDELRVNPYLDR